MKLLLVVICFIFILCTADCLSNIFRSIRGFGKGDHLASEENGISEDFKTESESVNGVEIPEQLFSKEVAQTRKSSCYRARLEFETLCGLNSAVERVKLASLVTNCHLEVSGRPIFEWDPVKKLEDADDSYIYLVMQFIPLMNSVCEKAGYSPMLAQLVSDTRSNDDLRDKIHELQDVTERLFEANRQSSDFVEEYMNMSADATRQLMELQNLTIAIQEANDAIDKQWEAIHQQADDIKTELRAFTKNSITMFDSMFGKFDGFQSQVSNMGSVVDQLQSDSRATSMFLRTPFEAFSNITGFMESPKTKIHSYWTSFPFASIYKVGLIKNIVLGPIKLSERIHYLESNRFLGPFAKDAFSSIQLILVLISVYIGYTVLTMVTTVMEAILQFAAFFKPLQPLIARVSHLFYKRHEQPGDAQQQRIQEQLKQLSERVSVSVSKALSSSKLAEKLAKIVRNDGTDTRFSLMFTRMSELDTRLSQISQDIRLLHHTCQSLDRLHVREPGISVISHGTVASHVKSLERPPNPISVITSADAESISYGSNHEAVTEPLGQITGIDEIKGNPEQSESAENNYKERDTRDKDSHTVAPKRELTRRRSSRKKTR